MSDTGTGQTGRIDAVVALDPPSLDHGAFESAVTRIIESLPDLRAILVYPPGASSGSPLAAQGTQWQFREDTRLAQDRAALAQSLGQSFRAIFETAAKFEVRACVIVTSDLSTVTAEWVKLLIGPVLNDGFDLVAPCYGLSPFDGVINRAIVYPLIRSLYGKRIRNPIGPDFGLSGSLAARMAAGARPRLHPLVSLVAEAIASDMKICQSHIGRRVYPSLDWGNLSPFLSQAMSALFLDVERFAPVWQRARGSQPVPEFGDAAGADDSSAEVDPAVLIQAFEAGSRAMTGIWGTVMPPSTLVDLQRLARQAPAHFRMGDETWARIVYDFALAHRLRPAAREQTLRSFTPIYMAWVASYALEIAGAAGEAVEQRIEELCGAFERMKPYFLSRWRWPDRFNP